MDCDALTAILDDGLLTGEEIATTRESGTSFSPILLPNGKWESWEMTKFNPQPKKFSASNS
ncbi:MAG: hypothetical protein P8P32_07580 [Akkermansiaceae bacterium]|nr:hypothetical protein [Akkermansiaceae bacterium]MDG1071455.1 hypothetical protein [Akkermansiaceae bacterium]MDG2324336.1 hypothetical protein [Akkermansiaceae bacterium]